MTHPLDPKRVCGALVFARAGGALGTPDARISRLVMVPPEQASWDAIQRSYSMGMTDFIGKVRPPRPHSSLPNSLFARACD